MTSGVFLVGDEFDVGFVHKKEQEVIEERIELMTLRATLVLRILAQVIRSKTESYVRAVI